MPFPVDEPESRQFVEVSGSLQLALRPQRDPFVTGAAGKLDTLLDQTLADSQPTCRGLDQQKAKLGDLL